jgi:hypothetical protein
VAPAFTPACARHPADGEACVDGLQKPRWNTQSRSKFESKIAQEDTGREPLCCFTERMHAASSLAPPRGGPLVPAALL